MGYYERDGRECYEAIAIATEGLVGFEAFAVGNVVKYAWRAGLKPGASFEEDMEKCGHYARMLCGREGK